jgi:hypothetical protein
MAIKGRNGGSGCLENVESLKFNEIEKYFARY